MSGVYIKGMEMPKNCEECPIKSWDTEDYVCPFSGVSTLCISRQANCPLIPVPDHGRLIDADEIGLTDFEITMCQKGNPFKNALKMLLDKIDTMPTIIPAEEADK